MSSRQQSAATISLLVLAVVVSFLIRPIPWGDSTGSVFGPISWQCGHGTIEGPEWGLDEFPFLYESAGMYSEYLPLETTALQPMAGGRRLGSPTGLGIKVAALPSLLLTRPRGSETTVDEAVRANVAVGVVWSVLGLLLVGLAMPEGWRAWGLLAFGLGSAWWPQLRQTMWGVTPAWAGIAFLLGMHERRRWNGWLAGIACGWVVLCRPVALLVVGPMWVAGSSRRDWWKALVMAAPFGLLIACDNLAHTGSVWAFPQSTWAAETSAWLGQGGGAWTGSLWAGLSGLLLSPARGLFIFSPWALLAIRRPERRMEWAVLVGTAAVVLASALYADWWGAAGWGPRRLAECLPGLVWLTAQRRPKPGRLAAGLLALAVVVNAPGALQYTSAWDVHAGTEGGRNPVVVNEGLWSVRGGLWLDTVRRPIPWGREPLFSLAPGGVEPAPIPVCDELVHVDRWPTRRSEP